MPRCEMFMLGTSIRCKLDVQHNEDHLSENGDRWNEYGSINPFEMRRQMLRARIARLESELVSLKNALKDLE